jgi:hypothetical protein
MSLTPFPPKLHHKVFVSAVAVPLLQLFVVQQEVTVVKFEIIVVPGEQNELHDHTLVTKPFEATHDSV